MIPLAHIRVPRSVLYTLRYPLALVLCAYYTFDLSLRVFLTFIRPSPYTWPVIPASFVASFILFLTAQVPPLSAYHIHFDFLTSSALSFCSNWQFRASRPSVCRARAPSSAPLQLHHVPCHSFVTTLLSLLILIDATSRACSSPSFLFLLRIICPDASRSLVSVPRGRPSLRSAAFTSFRYSRDSLHHSLRLCLFLPSVPTSIRLSNCVSLAFPYLRIFALHTSWLRLSLSTSPVVPCSPCTFPIARTDTSSSLACHSTLGFQDFPLSRSTLRFERRIYIFRYYYPILLSDSISSVGRLSPFLSTLLFLAYYEMFKGCPLSNMVVVDVVIKLILFWTRIIITI